MNEAMATVIRPDEKSETLPCPAYRGRGIKLCDSRRALHDGDEISSREREHLDYLGSGRTERNGK
jgi:hypothetical protein